MFTLRKLSIRDVGNALKRRDLCLAARISHNLGSNAVNAVRLRLSKCPRLSIRVDVRRPS